MSGGTIASHRPRRLGAVASLVPTGTRVADVGTDHGILPVILLARGCATYCIASELDARTLARLRSRAADPRLAARLELRSGDGLQALSPRDRIEVVVIAGLGARTILRILDEPHRERLGVGRYVLQPQTEWAELRRGLAERRLRIVEERLVLERGRFYVVMASVPDSGAGDRRQRGLRPQDLFEAGPCLARSADPLVRRFWSGRLAHQESILRLARPGPGRDRALRLRDLCGRVLATLPR